MCWSKRSSSSAPTCPSAWRPDRASALRKQILGDVEGAADDLGAIINDAAALGRPTLEAQAASIAAAFSPGSGGSTKRRRNSRRVAVALERRQRSLAAARVTNLSVVALVTPRLDIPRRACRRWPKLGSTVAARWPSHGDTRRHLSAVTGAAMAAGDLERAREAAADRPARCRDLQFTEGIVTAAVQLGKCSRQRLDGWAAAVPLACTLLDDAEPTGDPARRALALFAAAAAASSGLATGVELVAAAQACTEGHVPLDLVRPRWARRYRGGRRLQRDRGGEGARRRAVVDAAFAQPARSALGADPRYPASNPSITLVDDCRGDQMSLPKIASRDEWLAARTKLLAEGEGAHPAPGRAEHRAAQPADGRDRQGLRVRRARRARSACIDLFEGRPQLIIYHFMFDPEWEDGCPSCTAGTDEMSPGFLEHLHTRDTSYAMVSRAPLAKLERWKAKKGWDIPWYSSFGTDFNYDFGVTIDESRGVDAYNFRTKAEYEARATRVLRVRPAVRDARPQLLPAGRRPRVPHLLAVRPRPRVAPAARTTSSTSPPSAARRTGRSPRAAASRPAAQPRLRVELRAGGEDRGSTARIGPLRSRSPPDRRRRPSPARRGSPAGCW